MKNTKPIDHMQYMPDMEQITDTTVMEQVLECREAYDDSAYTALDVAHALQREILTPNDFASLLSPAAGDFLEQMAHRALQETRKHFGNLINLFTPLYLANHCENHCVYCGFNCYNKIRRARLSIDEIDTELRAIAQTGLREILLLTGESYAMSPVSYIAQACRIARRYFRVIGVEIYPLNVDDYAFLHANGVDYVTVFQETYNPDKYEKLHLEGHKRIFPYRFHAQERALRGGMRGVGFAALLGLDYFRKDAYATGMHAYLLQRKYPHAEISFSCPRLRPVINNSTIGPRDVHERQLLQIIYAYRIFMPYAAITISKRECAQFRNNVIGLAATKISAGVNVGIGGHAGSDKGDEQFEISDPRNVSEILSAITARGLQPIMADSLYV